MDVYFYETFAEEVQALQQILPSSIRAEFTDKTIEEAGHQKAPAAVISIRTQSRVPTEWKDDLKGVFSRSKGRDHLLSMEQAGVSVGSLTSYCSRAVAESAFLLMLALLRKLPRQLKQFSKFKRDGLTGREALNKSVLVFGVGGIGSEIVRLCQGFGMNVRGVDIEQSIDVCPLVHLEKGLSWADILFVAAPLTAETKGLLGSKTLRQAQEGLILVNIARGEITPVKDISFLLDEGFLGGVGLDVFEQESLLANDLRSGKQTEQTEKWLMLAKRQNVLCTPHNAFNSEEALAEKARLSAAAIQKCLKTGEF